ncbi:hypothetical protein ACIRJO_02600 [Streptomyces sp. NPDC102394]|uniref:hypothetical protein n=1 Tax=Streptomyces sp. NPDC102394 TaxID=3366167 RepID=UPI0038307D56
MRTSIAHSSHSIRDERETALRIVHTKPAFVPPLDIARDIARRVLDEANALDLDTATVGDVYGQRSALQESLRQVLAALDAQDSGHA